MIRLGDPVDGERTGADALLAALDRDRDATGPDIVAKIRADQEELIRTPADTLLVVEGGPGTGKTITALHRVARLIENGGLAAPDVLVVGPSPAFARYTRSVLVALGHEDVEHHAVGALLPKVVTGRDEALHVTRLKGEGRMADLLGRAVENHLTRLPAGLPPELAVDGGTVPLDHARLTQVLTTARASEAGDGDRRRILRAVMVSAGDEPRLGLAAADALADLLWPDFDPAAFLRELFASRELLTAAAAGEFTDREISALHRAPAASADDEVWSDADLPLLDEADHLAHGDSEGYGHVLVDEAQDLSPMQVRALVRRSATGSMTIVGDLAQSTGPWARDDWHDVLAQVPDGPPRIHRELRFGYRVPRQIFDLAAELLPTAAPSVQAPTTVRDGPAAPVIVPVGPADRAGVVVAAAADHAADGRTVAILCPGPCRAEIEARLREEDVPWRPAAGSAAGITLLTPREAKGLEFDVAVVVEPGFIVDDDPRGHRLLYTALTRPTSHLYLVGAAEDLPVVPPSTPAPMPAHTSRTRTSHTRTSHTQTSHTQTRPTQTGPYQTGSAQISPTRTKAAQVSPAQISPAQVSPAQISPAQVSPAQVSPAQVSPEPEQTPMPLDPAVREAINLVAHSMAETLLAHLPPELWPIALERVVDLITPDNAD